MKVDYYKKALWLSYFTVLYNIIEFIVSIIAGYLAGSIALIGFGSDSFVESLSGSIMIWRFKKHGKISEKEEEKIEKRATKLVAITFFILGFYILFESVRKLYFLEKPESSISSMTSSSFDSRKTTTEPNGSTMVKTFSVIFSQLSILEHAD